MFRSRDTLSDAESRPNRTEPSCVCSFSWEELSARRRDVSSFRLLAVGAQFDLKLLEVEDQGPASMCLLPVCDRPAELLLQAVRDQDPGEYQDQASIVVLCSPASGLNLCLQAFPDYSRCVCCRLPPDAAVCC